MKRGIFFLFFKRSISQRKGRTAIASISVAFAVMVITAMAAITLGIGEKLGSELKAYGANIIVSPMEGAHLDSGILEKIAMIDNVLDAEGRIFSRALIIGESVEVIGLDLKRYVEGGRRLSGDLPLNSHEVLGGNDLKGLPGIDENREILLEYEGKRIKYLIKGFIETGGPDDRAIIMSVSDARELMGLDEMYSAILVRGVPGSLENIVEIIKGIVTDASVKTFRQVALAQESLLNKIQLLMMLVTVVVLFAAIISVGGTMGANVLERKEEIGLMMAMGATKNRISLFYISEALVIGFLGGIIGYALGYLSAQIISQGAFDSFINIPSYILLLSLMTGLVVPLIASHFPVRNAMKESPAVILKGE